MPDSLTAPAPAPSAPPAPAPVAPPPTTPDRSGEGDFAELDELSKADAPAQQPPRRGSKRPEPPKAPEKPADKAPDKSPETPPEPAKSKAPEVPVKASELRTAYDQTKAKLKEQETELGTLRTKVQELEKTGATDLKPLQDQIATLQKQNAEYAEEIRFVNYQKHPEFLEKYDKPYQSAWQKAVSEVEQLTLTTEDGSKRTATANDLLALASAPLDQLDDLAEKWFGKSAARVIRHVEKVRDLASAKQEAIEQARKLGPERDKQMSERSKQFHKALDDTFHSTNKTLAEKYPKWFGPDEADAEATAALKKGAEFADSVFTGNGLDPVEKAKRSAIIRNQAAAFPRLVLTLKKRDARIAELEKDLAEYEKSQPGGGTGSEPAAVGDKVSGEDELDALDKAGK